MLHDSSSWGFPHSEICGSKLICSSPQLIAAYHVLLRLLMPRHSPYALVRLNFLHRSFDLCCSLNCLSFFVHISVCNKKASLFHRFVFVLRFHARRNCVLPYFVERPIFSQYYVLNICSFLLFHFYSVFNEHGFVNLSIDWLAQVDSNHRPRAYQARALTT